MKRLFYFLIFVLPIWMCLSRAEAAFGPYPICKAHLLLKNGKHFYGYFVAGGYDGAIDTRYYYNENCALVDRKKSEKPTFPKDVLNGPLPCLYKSFFQTPYFQGNTIADAGEFLTGPSSETSLAFKRRPPNKDKESSVYRFNFSGFVKESERCFKPTQVQEIRDVHPHHIWDIVAAYSEKRGSYLIRSFIIPQYDVYEQSAWTAAEIILLRQRPKATLYVDLGCGGKTFFSYNSKFKAKGLRWLLEKEGLFTWPLKKLLKFRIVAMEDASGC